MTDEADRPAVRESSAVALPDGGTDRSFLDRLFYALSKPRQRRLLSLLVDEPSVTRRAAAVRLAAAENDVPVAEVSDAERERYVTTVHHLVLPDLEAAELVEYDARRGELRRGSAFEAARPYLELARDDESA